jgi:hypothetical protein
MCFYGKRIISGESREDGVNSDESVLELREKQAYMFLMGDSP